MKRSILSNNLKGLLIRMHSLVDFSTDALRREFKNPELSIIQDTIWSKYIITEGDLELISSVQQNISHTFEVRAVIRKKKKKTRAFRASARRIKQVLLVPEPVDNNEEHFSCDHILNPEYA